MGETARIMTVINCLPRWLFQIEVMGETVCIMTVINCLPRWLFQRLR